MDSIFLCTSGDGVNNLKPNVMGYSSAGLFSFSVPYLQ